MMRHRYCSCIVALLAAMAVATGCGKGNDSTKTGTAAAPPDASEIAATSGPGSLETSGTGSAKGSGLKVSVTNKTCELSVSTLAAGRHALSVKNNADVVSEVYVYAEGDRIVGEVENVGPAITRKLIVDLGPGTYEVACKPGMTGKGIRSKLVVTGEAPPLPPVDERLKAAVVSYKGFVQSEAKSLTETTSDFVMAVKSGDIDKSKILYGAARLHYERIEPIAESFGNLDPLIDMREDDASATKPFVGFHRLESDLWKTNNTAASGPIADGLLANVKKLETLVATVEVTELDMANGAKELLDEVAKSKVTGEEERYSRIDLVDFVGNVEGSKYAYTALRPVVAERNPKLAATLDARFESLLAALETHRDPANAGQFVSYDALTPEQVKKLASEVDAISEPLGQLPSVLSPL